MEAPSNNTLERTGDCMGRRAALPGDACASRACKLRAAKALEVRETVEAPS